MTERNEAAERLHGAIGDRTILALPGKGHAELGSVILNRAIAAERRATVERIRHRLESISLFLEGDHNPAYYMPSEVAYRILDEEAAR